MQQDGLTIIQDWSDYDESLVSTNAENHYKDKGIELYSSHNGPAIPNEISNSYAHAFSLIKVLKEFLKTYKGTDPIQVLDAGCGSGIFARHFLIAAREEGILNDIQLLLGDYSKTVLEDIQEKQILKEFKENKNYKLLELDLLNLENTKDIKGAPFKLEELSLIVLNYVYDSLPMLVLRPSLDSPATYEKLQFKLLKDGVIASIEDAWQSSPFYLDLGSLLIEDRWQAYEPSNALQKKYYELLEPGKTNHMGQIFYNYASLAVTEELGKLLSKDGFIYATDIPHHESFKMSFQVYGNIVTHFINEPLITKLMHKLNYSSLISQDALLIKMFYFKNQETLKHLDPVLKEFFIDTSLTDIYADLRQCSLSIISPHSKELQKMILDKLLTLDSHSCLSHVARLNYYLKQGDQEKVNELIVKIRELDYLRDYS